MDTSKLQDAIAELEKEAARCQRLASEIREVIKRSGNGVDQSPVALRVRHGASASTTTSQLVVAVEVLRNLHKPTHITDLVPLVAERRKGSTTTRATVESALVRGMKGRYKNVVRRTSPGTFEVIG